MNPGRVIVPTTVCRILWTWIGPSKSWGFESYLKPHNADMSDDPSGWTGERLTLRHWLDDQNSHLGDAYAVVVELLFGRPMPGYAYFVCHGVREIGNRLPDVVLRTATCSRLEYKDHVETIARLWARGHMSDALTVGVGESSDPLRTPTTRIAAPRELVERIGELVDAHTAVRETNADRARRFFEYFVSPERVGADVIAAKARQWRATINWFVDRVHLRVDDPIVVTHDELLSHFDAFETPLASLFTGFYETLDKIDAILDEANRRSS